MAAHTAGANVTGFFRLTDTGVEVRYADGRGEMLTATPDGGVSMQRSAISGDVCLPQLVSRRPCLQRHRQEAGGGGICQPTWAWAPRPRKAARPRPRRTAAAPPPAFHPAEAKPHERPARIKPTSFVSPVAPGATNRVPSRLA